MISKKQLTANRRNARKSTGPKTAEGKAIVSQNALTHGLLSELRVLPGLERQEDWQRHIERTLADLNPVGYMEEILAERIALLLWRFGRVARYERETAAAAFENAESDLARNELDWDSDNCREASPLKVVEDKVQDILESLRLLERMADLPEDVLVSNGALIVQEVCVAAGEACYFFSSEFQYLVDSDLLTGGDLRDSIDSLAEHREISVENLLEKATLRIKELLAGAESEENAIVRRLEQYRRASILPDEAHLEKVHRYEAHLERAFYKAMHELQRLQAARLYGTPAPVAIDVTVDGDGVEGVDDHD